MSIYDYIVIDRDGLIIGCIALHTDIEHTYGAIACLAVHRDYRGGSRGQRLLDALQRKAKKLGLKCLFVLSTQAMHWFIERGFVNSDVNSLPPALKALYNPQRNSKILSKELE